MVFKKIIFQNSLMANETPSRPPPPFMANAILNFHFDYLNPSLTNIASGILTSWCIARICVFSVTFLGAFPLYNCDLRLLTSTKVYKVSLDGQLVVVESSWRSQNTSYPDILHTRWTLFSGLKVFLYNAHIAISYQVTVHLYNASRGNN